MSDREFERIGGDLIHEGRIVTFSVDQYRFKSDGKVVDREIVRHPGAVGVVAHDGEHVFLVRQPREPVNDPDVLEIPAGRLDKDGEDPEQAGKRELAEEIGKRGATWEHLTSFYSSVGVMDEVVHVYLATDLSEHHEDSGEDERIEIVRWPLSDLDGAIAASKDAKTKIGLLLLKDRLRA